MMKTARQFAVIALGLFVGATAAAQQPGMYQMPNMPNVPGMPAGSQGQIAGAGMLEIPNTELTKETGKGAIDAYLALREKYENKAAPEGDAQAFALGMRANAEVDTILTRNGFKNPREWQNTLTSIVLAHNFIKEGNRDEMDAKIAEMEGNTQIPTAIKDQLVQRMKSARPSDNNMKVVKQLMDDGTYGAKLANVVK